MELNLILLIGSLGMLAVSTGRNIVRYHSMIYPWERELYRRLFFDQVLNFKYSAYVKYHNAGDFEKAIPILRDCLQIAPDSSALVFRLCQSELNKNVETAERLARECLALNLGHWRASMTLAYLLEQRGEIDEAIHYSGLAVELAPDDAAAVLVHVGLLLSKSKHAQSLALVNRWLTPDGRYKRRWSRLARSTANKDTLATIRISRGISLVLAGRCQSALPDLLSHELPDCPTHIFQFWCQLAAENYAAASTLLGHLESPLDLHARASLEYAQGNFETARLSYTDCCQKCEAELLGAFSGLAWTYWKLGELGEVDRILQMDMADEEVQSSLLLLRAQLALDAGDVVASGSWLNQAEKMEPRSITYWQLWGQTCEGLVQRP